MALRIRIENHVKRYRHRETNYLNKNGKQNVADTPIRRKETRKTNRTKYVRNNCANYRLLKKCRLKTSRLNRQKQLINKSTNFIK
jgi:hypothetical protein